MTLPPARFPPLLVEAVELACERGGRLVFSGVSFSAGVGDLLALTGPNGAGKSSLLRLVAGLLAPAAGSLSIAAEGAEAGALTHYLGHAEGLKPALSLRENLAFWTALYGRGTAAPDILDATAMTGIDHALDLPASVLSAGQRRRAALARLLMSPRPLWLLDEPTSALDRDGEAMLGRLMRAHLGAGGVVIAATHLALPVEPTRTLRLEG